MNFRRKTVQIPPEKTHKFFFEVNVIEKQRNDRRVYSKYRERERNISGIYYEQMKKKHI
jgi:hypothetical protein